MSRTKLPKVARGAVKAVAKPKIPGATSRRQRYSDSTIQALVDAAEGLFTENGYAATSLDAIVAAAQVTKGALYHHFNGKQAIFEAVFQRIDTRASAAIKKATSVDDGDPWDMARAGLHAFLDVVQEQSYRRVVIQDGPSVLGYERFREQEGRSTSSNVDEIVRTVLQAGDLDVDEAMLDTFTELFFGALSAAGGSVAQSADPPAAAVRVEAAVTFILAGMQRLIAEGVAPAQSGLDEDPQG